MSDKIDVHIIQHPVQDRSKWLEPLLKQLEKEPVNVHLIPGVQNYIGEGRYHGFKAGACPLVSYVDDDDEIIPGIFDKILEEFAAHPHIDGLCTRERRWEGCDRMAGNFGHRYKYYDKRHFLRVHHITAYKRDSIAPYIHEMRDCLTTAEHTLVAHLMLNNAIIKHLPEVGYVWNEHAGSTPSLGLTVPDKVKALHAKVWAQAQSENFVSHIPDQGLIKKR